MEGASTMATIMTTVGTTLTSVLTQLSAIFTWMVGEPVIMWFIAFGFVGVMFRWARKLVHF